MTELENIEMKKIYGGAFSWGFISAIASGLVFIIGVFDGFVNPTKCRN